MGAWNRMTEMTPRQATGTESYQATRFNALRHGVLSQFTILPWEDEEEYCGLLDALVAEHKPKGPTEEHLVEEMAGILWRKRRLRLAEAAAFHRGLGSAISSDRQPIKPALAHLDTAATAAEVARLNERETMAVRALDLLQKDRGARAYDKALAALGEETRRRWKESIKPRPQISVLMFEEAAYTANAEGLTEFLRKELMPSYERQRSELENRPLIREQVIGEALEPEKLEGLARYEIHLDRKFERMLTMLIRLQGLRATPNPA
jgi:hypothetical protein